MVAEIIERTPDLGTAMLARPTPVVLSLKLLLQPGGVLGHDSHQTSQARFYGASLTHAHIPLARVS
jgi:hypothetical protein